MKKICDFVFLVFRSRSEITEMTFLNDCQTSDFFLWSFVLHDILNEMTARHLFFSLYFSLWFRRREIRDMTARQAAASLSNTLVNYFSGFCFFVEKSERLPDTQLPTSAKIYFPAHWFFSPFVFKRREVRDMSARQRAFSLWDAFVRFGICCI